MVSVFVRYRSSIGRREWVLALLHALPVTVLVLFLFYYWFAIADRYIIFLYYHDMGPLVPDTSPFSVVTSSRYWMTGLVAGGIVVVLYTGGIWLIGRLLRNYRPPRWWAVWTICWVPLLIGVPLITMTINIPTLPVWNAVQTTLATVVSVGFALIPGQLAGEHPGELITLSLDGLAMAGVLWVVIVLERISWLLERGGVWPLLIVVVGLVGVIALLLIVTGLRLWRRMANPSMLALIVGGVIVAYLLLPLAHYVVGGEDGGYHYISDKDNFFPLSWERQVMTWLLVAVVAGVVIRLRRSLPIRRTDDC